MSILAKVGCRTYEFETFEDLSLAYGIYARTTGNQDEFEGGMENAGVAFVIEPMGYDPDNMGLT